LPSYVGRTVSLVGKSITIAGPTLTLLASDSQTVMVHLGGASCPQTQYVEVIGRVRGDGSVDAVKAVPFGDALDLDAYNEMVTLTQGKYAYLFA